MDEVQQGKTVEVKACAACSSGLLEHDKFCRWCGVSQARQEDLEVRHSRPIPAEAGACSSTLCATVALPGGTRPEVFRRISGPLVNTVATGALAGSSKENGGLIVNRMILALISIPIWLIIVLLSPLDAYAAVKNLTRQV